MFFLFLESLFIYGNPPDILVYTSTAFGNRIKNSHLFHENIKFAINDTYSIDKACKAKLDLFELPISKYDKILYLDTDILIKDDVQKVFDLCKEDILYVVEEGTIEHQSQLFGDEKYEDKSAFTSGILLFNNCEKIRYLFQKIKEDMINRPFYFVCHDQPYIVYNAFKYQLFNNKVLKSLVVNQDTNIHSDKVIHHFSGDSSIHEDKIEAMALFLNSLNELSIATPIRNTVLYINEHLLPLIEETGELLEGNLFMNHHTTSHKDIFPNKIKNISKLLLNKNIERVMEIGFNSGFSALLMLLSNPTIHITCFDIGEHNYTMPCYEKLKATFGERINLIVGDSRETIRNTHDTYDLIHIDGGHLTEVAMSDINQSYRLSKNGTILIMDDYDFDNLCYLWDNSITIYNLKPLVIPLYYTPHHDIKYVTKRLENKTYTWGDGYITFLDNFEMNAFGKGTYKFIYEQTIVSYFGGKEHIIHFNKDYTSFTDSITNSSTVITGNLV